MINYKKVKSIAVLSESKGYSKELNVISFNDGEPLYDLRKWYRFADDVEPKMLKGITLNRNEIKVLKAALNAMEDL